jgi:hypothetical protein
MILWYVDQLHVGVSDYALAKDLLARMRTANRNGSNFDKETRFRWTREGLQRHRENRGLYLDVTRGRV